MLLSISRQKGELLNLLARDASDESGTARDVVSASVHQFIDAFPQGREIIREPFAVNYGGKTFFRADAKKSSKDAATYHAFIATRFRGYFIHGLLTAKSAKELDQAVDVLSGISFQEDRTDPRCSMADAPSKSGRAAKGILTPMAGPPGPGQRVRISQGVAQGLLVEKVQPEYPAEARAKHIEGQVVLRAIIDENGSINDLSVVSGDPLLAPSALAAVKQWKYKPYLLNGQPVNAETEVIVNFALSDH